MQHEIERALDRHIRPALREHGGDVEVVRVEGDTVFVRLLGQCSSCASAYYTVDDLIEAPLREHVPGIEHVVLDEYDMELYRYARELLANQTGP